MIEINQLNKKYERTEVLNDIDLSVSEGAIYGLLGSNGAGKTTLLKIISGLLKQNNGSVKIDNSDVFEQPNIKEELQFIPDTPFFFPHYTIQQMGDFYQSCYSNWNQDRFYQLEKIFKIDRKEKIHTLSKGMQRQVSFWLALSAMPSYLILDEPFDGLDAVIRKKIKQLLIADVAERNMTIMISSHNLKEVEDICDQIGIIHQGELIIEKSLDDLKSDVHKIQVAFSKEIDSSFLDEFTCLHKEKRGSIHLYIIKGQTFEIDQYINKYQPIVYDRLPLTLEEVFVYEMEGVGYAIENILV
ncbi:ABC-2 type transport system ATP-binding protein [Pelagirhabdus alkalitolerans]|uniref:ABC-2 type transport system ATP-binding protein n=1 Tax=Pelagirhabdus alkalitolerans TaxID=1612202 RepID=A0A1G6GYG1_9BACI|nr:ABC transporter ATP-binding protein [Pelagirhabdus alkalitolerans]SDB86715.1 ABC-2 type transport system ATP-binding protein [Pelagirhabdus alkalitolerans]